MQGPEPAARSGPLAAEHIDQLKAGMEVRGFLAGRGNMNVEVVFTYSRGELHAGVTSGDLPGGMFRDQCIEVARELGAKTLVLEGGRSQARIPIATPATSAGQKPGPAGQRGGSEGAAPTQAAPPTQRTPAQPAPPAPPTDAAQAPPAKGHPKPPPRPIDAPAARAASGLSDQTAIRIDVLGISPWNFQALKAGGQISAHTASGGGEWNSRFRYEGGKLTVDATITRSAGTPSRQDPWQNLIAFRRKCSDLGEELGADSVRLEGPVVEDALKANPQLEAVPGANGRPGIEMPIGKKSM